MRSALNHRCCYKCHADDSSRLRTQAEGPQNPTDARALLVLHEISVRRQAKLNAPSSSLLHTFKTMASILVITDDVIICVKNNKAVI
jgi:hypothetical protein